MSTTNLVPVFILAGGLGTRFSEETVLKPKPMIEVGEIPILVHIMRWYYSFGFNDFVICAGYRSWEIKNYFLDYEFRRNHMMIDHRASADLPPLAMGRNTAQERWRVKVIDTGLESNTGARVARAFDEIAASDGFQEFALTYGDGLSDVDLTKEYGFHREHGRLGTVLGVHPTARFGELDIGTGNKVEGFLEKPESKPGVINGGFFFFKRDFRKYLAADPECVLERDPLAKLAGDSQLMMFKHTGFWQPMDTQRDKNLLQGIWDSGKAPWLPKS
jgi:glucose-1-phosphate cytidylyltransferase